MIPGRTGRAAGLVAWIAAAAVLAATAWARTLAGRADDARREAELRAIERDAARRVADRIAGASAAADALVPLLAAPASMRDDAWLAAAWTATTSRPGTVAVGLVSASGRCDASLPESACGDVERMFAGSRTGGAVGEASAAVVGADPYGFLREGTRIVVTAPAGAGRTALVAINPEPLLRPDGAPDDGGVSLRLQFGEAPGESPRGGEPGRALGLPCRVHAEPDAAWTASRRQPGGDLLLAAGTAAAVATALAGWAWQRSLRAAADADEAHARAAAAGERARVASFAREAIAREASHVIRARIRETARALDAASDPRADDAARRDALLRIGASLAQGESEVDALLQPPTHTHVARAEHEAALLHHYSQTVLEFPGGPSIELSSPVPEGALAAVQRQLGKDCFAVITSDNPMSAPLTDEANMLRRGVLGLELRSAGLAHLPVVGRSRDRSWSERGFAVAASVAQADALAAVHEQRAYFWFDGSRFALHEAVGERRTIALPRGRGG